MSPELLWSLPLGAIFAFIAYRLFEKLVDKRISASIDHEYAKNFERIKNELEAEFRAKDKIFNERIEQYKKYFTKIDEASYTNPKRLFEIMHRGFSEILESNSADANVKFNKEILDLLNEEQSRVFEFKKEINGLKLQAGAELLTLINEFEKLMDGAMGEMQEIFEFAKNRILNEPEKLTAEGGTNIPYNSERMAKIKEIQEKIFWEMRRELGIK